MIRVIIAYIHILFKRNIKFLPKTYILRYDGLILESIVHCDILWSSLNFSKKPSQIDTL